MDDASERVFVAACRFAADGADEDEAVRGLLNFADSDPHRLYVAYEAAYEEWGLETDDPNEFGLRAVELLSEALQEAWSPTRR